MVRLETSSVRLINSLVLMFFVASAVAQNSEWIKIDDFEEFDSMENWVLADTRNDTNPRIENPQITEVRREVGEQNKYLLKKPAAEGILGNRKALSFRELPTAVNVGEIYTFYARFNIEYFPNNHVFGLSNLQPQGIIEHDYNALEPSLRITDKYESDGYKNDGTLMVRKDDGYEKIFNTDESREAKPLKVDTWYEVWYVVNNKAVFQGGQTYDVYLRGGDEFSVQKKVYEDAEFRMKRELPLIYFLTNCNTGPGEKPYGNGGLRYDDLYMIGGVVLTSPLN